MAIQHGAAPSHTKSDLRQTAIDEYFASRHKAAVIGGEEQGHGSRFVRVAHTFKWCLTGKTSKKSLLHSRLRQSIEKTWRCCIPRREHIDPDACTLQVQRPASSKIPDGGLRCAVHAEGGRSHGTCSRSREYDGAASPHQRKRLLHRKQGSFKVHIENLSNWSSLIEPKGLLPPIPALANSTSTCPFSACTVANSRSRSSRFDMSP